MTRRLIFTLLFFGCTLITAASSAWAARTKVDFNGDGRADVFLYNIFSGDVAARFSSGSGVLASAAYGNLPPKDGWLPIALSDFNGDGRTDMVLRNTRTGELRVAYVDGDAITEVVSFGAVDPNSGWIPIDVSDYDSNGRADVLWRNSNSGEMFLLLPGGQSWSPPAVHPSSGFLPVAFGDMNGDCSTDILWRHGPTGQLAVWLMNGNAYSAEAITAIDPASNWAPITLADFSGDGRADILLRNGVTGELHLLVMNGSRIAASGPLPGVDPGTPLVPVALNDFNGDGSTDILWRNTLTGDMYVWLMKGTQSPQVIPVGTFAPGSGWFPIATDDFNGDHRGDILLRNAFSEELAVLLMNGSMAQQISFGELPASSVWQIQIPR